MSESLCRSDVILAFLSSTQLAHRLPGIGSVSQADQKSAERFVLGIMAMLFGQSPQVNNW